MDNKVSDSGIDGYLSVKDAAIELGLSYKSVQRHIKNGALKAKKVSGVYFFPQAEVERFKPRLSGRPRSSVPQWRFSPEGNLQIGTSVEGSLREGVSGQEFVRALEKVKRSEAYLFEGTIARYVLSEQEDLRHVQFLFIWRETVMPEPAAIERALADLGNALTSVLAREEARITTRRIWMHT